MAQQAVVQRAVDALKISIIGFVCTAQPEFLQAWLAGKRTATIPVHIAAMGLAPLSTANGCNGEPQAQAPAPKPRFLEGMIARHVFVPFRHI